MHNTTSAINDIEKYADPTSSRYGKLLNWPDPVWPIWHYGIGLSDTYIFDTGKGWQAFQRVDAKEVIGVDHLHLASADVIDRLKKAVECFKSWSYHLLGWNCEHMSRLVATQEARCYAIGPVLGLRLAGDGVNHDADKLFAEYIKIKDS